MTYTNLFRNRVKTLLEKRTRYHPVIKLRSKSAQCAINDIHNTLHNNDPTFGVETTTFLLEVSIAARSAIQSLPIKGGENSYQIDKS